MIDFLGRVTSPNPEIIRFLRSYQCGYKGRSAKVCCPNNPIPLNVLGGNIVGKPKPVIPRPPDVTNHRNIPLLPSVANCGLLSSRDRIVNGNKTSLFEFPWMTLLSYRTRNGPDFRCGGTLINDRYVLTAAHCITHLDNLTLLGVRLGEYNISSAQDCSTESKDYVICADPVQDIFVEEVIPHPNYNFTTYSNDIGLLRLSSPAQLKESVQPICLPIQEITRDKNHTSTSLLVTGWGSTGSRSRRSDDLLKVEIPVIPEADCKAAYNLTPAVINYRQLCAGGKNRRDSCGGDSGGPLQWIENLDDEIHFVQYGIVSFGPRSCGQEGLPGVYTRLDYYMDWILDNMQWFHDDTGCRTPDRGVGDCVIIRECKSMLDFLEQVTSITQEIYGIVQSYQCGVQGKSVKVCCPEEPITIKLSGGNNEEKPIPVTPTTSSIPKLPDVTKHRNIRLLPSALHCGTLPSEKKISNGNKTALYEFPWMTLLSYQTRSGPDFRCGGTLINDRYVLTAAHCIANLDNLKLIGVRLGEYNISSAQDCEMLDVNTVICADPVQDIPIEEVIPHPDYNHDTFSDDIGLLRLRSPAIFKESVQPICLPTYEELRNKNFTNDKLVVTGWGSTGINSRRSDDLLKVEISIIPEAECRTAYDQTPAVINHKQLCAGGKNSMDSCGGDSGGPLQLPEVIDGDLNFVQFGIVSFGPRSCGLENVPGVYTRIGYYLDWILDNIRA